MPLKFHDGFDRAIIQYMMRNSPTLQRISVAFFEYDQVRPGDSEMKIRQNVEIWEKKVMATSEASFQPLNEPHHRLLSMDGRMGWIFGRLFAYFSSFQTSSVDQLRIVLECDHYDSDTEILSPSHPSK